MRPPVFLPNFRHYAYRNSGKARLASEWGMFDPKPYLKELARGKNSARDLTREQARTLFSAVFAGEVSDLALGALLVALRVKGESLEELAGMMDALQPHLRPMELPARRATPVLIPSYNGARKLANLVPLLALLLAREDVPVLLHGVHQEASRVGSFEILEMLGHPCVGSIGEAEDRMDAHKLAAVPVSVLSPDLAMLIAIRLETGVRNSGHTLAKLILPNGVAPNAACRLIAVTHPDFLKLLRDYFSATPANVFLMRGVEGEPVLRLHAPQPIEEMKADGTPVTHLIGEGDLEFPLPAREAAATAQWTRAVLDGQEKLPVAIAREVALIVEHCRTAANAGRPGLTLVSSK
jgi:anthranilate phosphoribosyltransferase